MEERHGKCCRVGRDGDADRVLLPARIAGRRHIGSVRTAGRRIGLRVPGPVRFDSCASQGSVVLSARMRFSICRRYGPARNLERMRVLVVEDEPYMAEAIRDGLRLEAIAADIAGDGDTALDLLSINAYDIAVLDRDIPGPSGDEIAESIVASGSGMPILML